MPNPEELLERLVVALEEIVKEIKSQKEETDEKK